MAQPGEPTVGSDEAFRLLIESVADYAIFMLDPAGRVVSWSRGAERIKGYSADEIIGQHFSVFYPPEDVAAGMCDRELETATNEARVEAEGWRLRKDGSRFWATVAITAMRDDAGNLKGFAKVTRDITERREANVAIRKHERLVDELRLSQRHALEVNDDIIQGLAVADLALNLDDTEKARDVIASTLAAARRFVTDLMTHEGEVIPIAPGDLRKGERRAGP